LGVPQSLHRRWAEQAKAEGASLNAVVATPMAEGLGLRTRPSGSGR
jgi:hypothetical protein